MRHRRRGLVGAEGACQQRQKGNQHNRPEHDAECQRYIVAAPADRRPRCVLVLRSVLEPETLWGLRARSLGIPVRIRGHGSPALSGALLRPPGRSRVRLPLPTRARNAHRLSVPSVRYDNCQQNVRIFRDHPLPEGIAASLCRASRLAHRSPSLNSTRSFGLAFRLAIPFQARLIRCRATTSRSGSRLSSHCWPVIATSPTRAWAYRCAYRGS